MSERVHFNFHRKESSHDDQETVVGLDVHADSITAAILPPASETPEVVKLSGDLMQVRRLFRRLSAEGPVRSCYEASGAGFVLQRLLDLRWLCLRGDRSFTHSEKAG